MMMKQDTTTPARIPTSCSNCGVVERRLLHHVRHRGVFRRFCTSCVLRLHPQSFCPICFLVYDKPQSHPPNDSVTCFKCYSSSHSHCVGSSIPNPYVCPNCTNPSVPIFDVKKAKDGDNCKAIDEKAARVLLAAAKIAAGTMSKAVTVVRTEAERRAKEAAFTRKRAREAMEHVAFLLAKEKLESKEVVSVEISGSGNVGAQEKNKKGGNADNVGNQIGSQCGEEGVDVASEVLASLIAVELREKERLQEFMSQNTVTGSPSNGVPMSVNDNDKVRVSPVFGTEAPTAQNHVNGNESERTGHSGNLESDNAQGEKVKNVLLSVSPVDQLQHMPNSHDRGENNLGSQQ